MSCLFPENLGIEALTAYLSPWNIQPEIITVFDDIFYTWRTVVTVDLKHAFWIVSYPVIDSEDTCTLDNPPRTKEDVLNEAARMAMKSITTETSTDEQNLDTLKDYAKKNDCALHFGTRDRPDHDQSRIFFTGSIFKEPNPFEHSDRAKTRDLAVEYAAHGLLAFLQTDLKYALIVQPEKPQM